MGIFLWPAEVKGVRKFRPTRVYWFGVGSGGMAEWVKPGKAAAFRFKGIYRTLLVVPSTRMCHMVSAARYGSLGPTIVQIKNQWGIDAYPGM